jgi:hypothetical protein
LEVERASDGIGRSFKSFQDTGLRVTKYMVLKAELVLERRAGRLDDERTIRTAA